MYLYIILCICFAAAFIYFEHQEKYVPAVVLKGLASLCFVLLGKSFNNDSQTARLIVLGLLLGCIADILLNLRFVFEKKGKIIFLVGILVFLSGHIVYLCAILPYTKNVLLCVVAGVVLTALLMKWIFTKITAQKAFKIFGIVYIGAIVLFNIVAFSNMLTAPSTFAYYIFCGAVFFLISDIVLILNTFGSESKFSLRITNLSLYYIGQLLIALSIRFIK